MQERQTFIWSNRPSTNKTKKKTAKYQYKDNKDKVTNVSYLCLKILHGLLKRLGWCPLVVTQDGYCSVSPIVGEDFRRNIFFR